MHGLDEIVNAQYRDQPKGQGRWTVWYLAVIAGAVGLITTLDLVVWQSFVVATLFILIGCGLVTWARIRAFNSHRKSSGSEGK